MRCRSARSSSVDARRRDPRDGRLEHAAHVQQLVLQIVAVAQDRRERGDQPVDVELLGKRALAVARDEQTIVSSVRNASRIDPRLTPNRSASGRSAGSGWPAGKRAVENQHPDAVGDLLRDPRLSDRLDQRGTGAGGTAPGGRRALDTPRGGCQTRPSNWFDHRASFNTVVREIADCGSAERIQRDCGLRPLAIEFVANGSPKVVSRAIEEFARGQGHVTAIVVPWESDGTTLSMAVTAVKSDGWAIEHTNLGTIRLADAGPGPDRRGDRRRGAEPCRAAEARRGLRPFCPADPEPVPRRSQQS